VVLRKNSFFVLVSLPPSHPSCLHRNNRGDTQSAEKKEKSVGVKNMIRFWIMSLSECRDIKKKKNKILGKWYRLPYKRSAHYMRVPLKK
jgi:hypothetical protein